MTNNGISRLTKSQLIEAIHSQEGTYDTLTERITELEMVLQDQDSDWQRLSGEGGMEFSRVGLESIIRQARLMYLKNPLIQRATRVQAHYVFGQGFSISAGDETVNDLIQRFLDDRANVKCLTGHQASVEAEIELTVTGNLFLALFSDASSGRVILRCVPVEQVQEIITNPEDSEEPWFYKRQRNVGRLDSATGQTVTQPVTTYHPDWRYRPSSQPLRMAGADIDWDAPIYHAKIGGFSHMKFGVPEFYAALDWAGAVKKDLEDYASLRRSLSRYAWRVTATGGARGVAALKSRFNTTVGDGSNQGETNPAPTVGAMFIGSGGNNIEPIRTAGAAPHPDEGRRLWLMVSAGTGIPETILAGDADVGNLATAKSLDRPTELQMNNRIELWKSIYEDLTSYVLERGADTPKGLVRGVVKLERDDYTGERTLQVKDEKLHVDVDFPSILERDVVARVEAIVSAVTLDGKKPAQTMTEETMVRELLSALGIDDIDKEWGKLEKEIKEEDERKAEMVALLPPPPGQAPDDPDAQAQQEARVTGTMRELDEVLRRTREVGSTTYTAVHKRMLAAKKGSCSSCGELGETQMSLIKGKGTHVDARGRNYSLNTKDYKELCRSCHTDYDKK